ncbi:MAG TPA: roadblock/LC7 domain-containing protein [Thermoanaerobaculia bacterium]|nr:roadblock/LC7 domain-containing protein [Thermoanaerobaculia bacterium]HUM30464.1 roadblock/LC7 domain-containing protein [Thermoanaerobaculia bacterium]HXK68669.1 roadblock/LC7 domain-containing protein [Thermoanaerobaculia bacterium]
MEFESILRDACTGLEGILGVSLVGLDGIAIAAVNLEGTPDLDSMAAELTTFLKTIRSTSSTIDGDTVNHMVIYTPHSATVLHGVTTEYFILAMIQRPAILGKIRFKLLRAALRLKEEMS